jgi:hypothetical protein
MRLLIKVFFLWVSSYIVFIHLLGISKASK